MLLGVDNYEELQQTMKDNEPFALMGQIEYTVSKYVSENGGLMVKTRAGPLYRDHIEERNLRGIISSRFQILEEVRAIENEANQVPTLSIGVGGMRRPSAKAEQFSRQLWIWRWGAAEISRCAQRFRL